MGLLIRTGGNWNWLTDLSEPAFAAVEASCTRRSYQDGESVYHRGDASNSLFQVISGRFKIRNYSVEGRELLYTYLEPGDCFGELGVIDGQPRHHDVNAVGNSELAVLAKRRLLDLRKQHNEIDWQLMVMLSRRTRYLYHFYEDAFLCDLRQRLAERLRHIGASALEGADGDETPALVTSHEDLAKMVGASRQSVTTVLKAWEREGVIRQEYGRIWLLDPQALPASSER